MIQLLNVCFSYTNNKNIYDNFNYKFNDNGLYFIEGESGSGKTTLLNLIGGILKPQGGEIIYDYNTSIKDISYIVQDNNLLENLTVYENAKTILDINNIKFDEHEFKFYLNELQLTYYEKTVVSSLSSGERKRVCILITILRKSKIILADELFSILDEDNSIIIAKILKSISKNSLVIIANHNKEISEVYGDFIINLEQLYNINEEKILGTNKLKNSEKFSFKLLIELISLQLKLYHFNKFNLFQFISSIIILAFNLAIIVLALSINTYDINRFFSHYIDEFDQTSVVILKTEANEKLNLDDYNYNYLYSLNINSKDLSGYKENNNKNKFFKNDLVFNYACIDDSIEDNEIVLTDYIVDYLFYVNIINDNNIVGYELDLLGKKFKIHDVIYTNYKNENEFYELEAYKLIYMNKVSYNENILYNFDTCCGVKINNATKDEITSIELEAYNYNYNLDLKFINELKTNLISFNNFRMIMKYLAIVIMVVSSFWILYLGYVRNKINDRYFKVLNLYGLNKIYIFLIMLFDSIIIFILSSILGSLIGYFTCNMAENIFKNIGSLSLNISFYNNLVLFKALIYVFILIILLSILGYLLSLFFKKKSHLS